MKIFVRGTLAGLVTAALFAWLLSKTNAFPLPNKIAAVAVLAVDVSAGWWVIGTVRAFFRWAREALERRRIRKQRRLNLVAERARGRGPTFEIGPDEETVPLNDAARVASVAPWDDVTAPTGATLARGVTPQAQPDRRDARYRGRQVQPPPPVRRFQMSQRQIAEHLQYATLATRQGDFRVAVELLTEVIRAEPDHLQARLDRGRIHLALGDYNRAMNDFVAAEDLAPDGPEPPAAMGELYFARKDYARAIGSFDVSLGLDPTQGMVYFLRGLCHHQRKNYPLALEDLSAARKISPEIPNLETHLGMAERKVREMAREKDKRRHARAY